MTARPPGDCYDSLDELARDRLRHALQLLGDLVGPNGYVQLTLLAPEPWRWLPFGAAVPPETGRGVQEARVFAPTTGTSVDVYVPRRFQLARAEVRLALTTDLDARVLLALARLGLQ